MKNGIHAFAENMCQINMPEMISVRQIFPDNQLQDIDKHIAAIFQKETIKKRIEPGMKVALAVGSRGIFQIDKIVKKIGWELKRHGAHPYIIPSMGSHGSGTAEGQIEVLKKLGITEKTMEMPIFAGMETVELGKTEHGIDICIARTALEADMIVPVARVKPHTDFRGPIESGICKMLAIGLGKHNGCMRLHQQGFDNFPWIIPEAGSYILQNAPIGFAIAIIENAYDRTFHIEGVPSEDILKREPELLCMAKEQMPRIYLNSIDLLIVEQLGKEISGAGMDPNIIGRTTRGRLEGYTGPKIQRILVKGITPASNGNACGIGLADFVLGTCVKEIDPVSTAINAISSGNPEAARIPITVQDEEEGLRLAMLCCTEADKRMPKVVRISNTLALQTIEVSTALLKEVENHPQIEIV